MSEKDYYPAGAYNDPSAPYNEPCIPERSFDVDVVFVVSKTRVQVQTSDYVPEVVSKDEQYVEPIDTSNTDWRAAYNECGHYTIPEMLETLKVYAENDLKNCKPKSYAWYRMKHLIESCQGWVVEEETYEESK